MALLLKYDREAGTIVGVWESTNLDVLQAQRVEADPVYGYLLSLLAVAASTLEHDYLVQDGAVVPRSDVRKGQ